MRRELAKEKMRERRHGFGVKWIDWNVTSNNNNNNNKYKRGNKSYRNRMDSYTSKTSGTTKGKVETGSTTKQDTPTIETRTRLATATIGAAT